MIRLVSVVLAAVLTFVCAAPAAADEPAVDLAVTVTLDQPEYRAFDEVTATVTVVNNGAAPATAVYVTVSSVLPAVRWEWREERRVGRLDPGARVTLTAFTMAPNNLAIADLMLPVTAELNLLEPDRAPADNRATVEAPLRLTTANLSGVVYGDRNNNRVIDPGEPLTGVGMEFPRTAPPGSDAHARTDGEGRFAVSNLLVGPYLARTSLPAGWQLENAQFDLSPGANQVVLRAVRQVAAQLTATVTFDRDTYEVGDTARQRVTLTNRGTVDLERITARCNGTGSGFAGATWGVLKVGFGNGVPIRAGETRTFDFTEVVPERGWRFGHMVIDCVFGGDDYGQNGARAYAKVAVPGGHGRVTGIVSHEDGPIPNLKLYLVDDDGRVAARAVTDAAGAYDFADTPANRYELRVVGPWRTSQGIAHHLQVFADGWTNEHLYLVAGPTQPDPDAAPTGPTTATPTTGAPTPQAAAGPRPANLADTGASVGELSALALLLLLTGSALLLVGRNPRSR